MSRSSILNRGTVSGRISTSNRAVLFNSGSTSRKLINNNFAGISNAVLYFDPRYGITFDGSNNISAWADLSDTGTIATASGTAQPTYSANGFATGVPAVSLDGVNDVMQFLTSSALTGVKNFTMFVVVKPSVVTGTRHVFNLGADASIGPGFSINANGTGKREIFSKGVSATNDGTATTNAEIWSMTIDNSALMAFRLNDQSQVLDAPATAVNSYNGGGNIGARTSAGFYGGLIGHILVYNSLLSSGNITTIFSALNTIYGIF